MHISKKSFESLFIPLKSIPLFSCSLIFSLFGFLSPLSAEEVQRLQIGDSLPTIALVDAFDKESPLPTNIEKILFVSDMEASKLVVPFLESKGDPYLVEKKAALVSDIHRMPSLITRFVAMPKMQSYPFTIRLIREEKWGDPFPRNKGQVTLLNLEKGKVTQINYTDSEKGVQEFLETPEKETRKKTSK